MALVMTPRKEQILTALIEEYIRTGEPVGSKWLMDKMGNTVSSATIRNEMAELTVMGYLDQPHTSAGRVPTPQAFRLYIDKLMKKRRLSEAARREIDDRLERATDPDMLMEEASQILAEDTGCAAVTTTPQEQQMMVRRVEVMIVSPHVVAMMLMTGSGVLRSRVCRLPLAPTTEQLTTAVGLLNRCFVGRPLQAVTLPAIQNLLLQLGEDALVCAPLLTAFHELAQTCAEAEVRMKGQLNLLRNPDYHPEIARSLLGFLTEQNQLVRMLAGHDGGLRVVLGNESLQPELMGSSIIVTRYAPHNISGSIGLIGPLRMDYATAIAELEYITQSVERILAQLIEE
ncbi:MAG: heat-inducible transcription repressor HrcA [Clostridia bacterium]|nr:heat-inducible transcription repressor HrcA [Clostridia bacterium]